MERSRPQKDVAMQANISLAKMFFLPWMPERLSGPCSTVLVVHVPFSLWVWYYRDVLLKLPAVGVRETLRPL